MKEEILFPRESKRTVPWQTGLVQGRLEEYIRKLKKEPKDYTPIPAIELDQQLITIDGHHTFSCHYILSKPIKLIVLESNEEIRNLEFPIILNHGIQSLEEFREKYESESIPRKKQSNVNYFQDLKIYGKPYGRMFLGYRLNEFKNRNRHLFS
jgi:hypothetical protein